MAYKPMRLSDSTVAISSGDPAIDREATGADALKRYADEWMKNPACFRELLKARMGEQFVVYTIGVIHPDEMIRLIDECRLGSPEPRYNELFWRSFLAGVRDVKGWPCEPTKRKIGDVEYVDPGWLKEQYARGHLRIALDIGAQVWHWNQLTEDEAKNS